MWAFHWLKKQAHLYNGSQNWTTCMFTANWTSTTKPFFIFCLEVKLKIKWDLLVRWSLVVILLIQYKLKVIICWLYMFLRDSFDCYIAIYWLIHLVCLQVLTENEFYAWYDQYMNCDMEDREAEQFKLCNELEQDLELLGRLKYVKSGPVSIGATFIFLFFGISQ